MKCWKSVVLGTTIVAVAIGSQGVKATDDHDHDHGVPQSVTLSFGAGLNTPPATNHHVLPGVTKVRTKLETATTAAVPGVVNFVMGGFHQIFVYEPGVTPDDITMYLAVHDPTNSQVFINDEENLFYTGVNPAQVVNMVLVPGANTIPPVNLVRPGNQNRTESVGFTVPGMYLVICNVRPHFQDGMTAWIKVVADDDDDN